MAGQPCSRWLSATSKNVTTTLSATKHRTTSFIIHTRSISDKQVGILKRKKEREAAEKRKAKAAKVTHFTVQPLNKTEQFSLCEAIRILRAFEVGYPPSSPKYELAIKLSTPKDGPVLKSRLNLPVPISTALRVCALVPPDSKAARAASAAGATLVGLEDVLAQIKEGKVDFDRCIASPEALPIIQRSGVARILGPRRLMPSEKDKTVVKDVGAAVREMTRAAEYRERMSVIRMAIGEMAFSAKQLKDNVAAFVGDVRRRITALERSGKEIHEVVLSSTHGPGLTLDGKFMNSDGTREEELVERA
ncbi:ribosomal protein L1 [Microthyrium microscopicum]|uniref:Ribosomal protein L1 n=1 Tax=Microthyrium microscopicum TaxID=703497 RepID=A0A6A6UM69_9PEZI|nr:ribosomal protein L1 [Microthyrium microscopicum]